MKSGNVLNEIYEPFILIESESIQLVIIVFKNENENEQNNKTISLYIIFYELNVL